VSMSDELKERNILKLILIVRFACVTLDVGHPINQSGPVDWICLPASSAREKPSSAAANIYASIVVTAQEAEFRTLPP
jgi:hypothetical protein